MADAGPMRTWQAVRHEQPRERLRRYARRLGSALGMLAVVMALGVVAALVSGGVSFDMGTPSRWLRTALDLEFLDAPDVLAARLIEGFRLGYIYQPLPMLALCGAAVVPLLALCAAIARAIVRRTTRRPGAPSPGGDATHAGLAAVAWLDTEAPVGESIVRLGELTAIGRGEDCDVVLPDLALAETHAIIQLETGSGHAIVDVSGASVSLILVNGHAVRQARLCDYDRIDLGSWSVIFRSDTRQPQADSETKVRARQPVADAAASVAVANAVNGNQSEPPPLPHIFAAVQGRAADQESRPNA